MLNAQLLRMARRRLGLRSHGIGIRVEEGVEGMQQFGHAAGRGRFPGETPGHGNFEGIGCSIPSGTMPVPAPRQPHVEPCVSSSPA